MRASKARSSVNLPVHSIVSRKCLTFLSDLTAYVVGDRVASVSFYYKCDIDMQLDFQLNCWNVDYGGDDDGHCPEYANEYAC